MGETRNFDGPFIRLLGLGLESQKQLASIVGVSQAVVSHAKKENRFPEKWVSKLCRRFDVTPEWLLWKEPKVSIHDLFKLITEDRKKISALETGIHFLHQRVEDLEDKMSRQVSGIKRQSLKIVGKKVKGAVPIP